ncbi:MAG TPA: hypothetical protein VM658_10715 [bacterium]|nr:hypothetical protein [bacterium]
MSHSENRPRPPRRLSSWAGEIAAAGLVLLAVLLACKPFSHLGDYTSTPLIDPAGVLQVYPWHHFNLVEFRAGHFPLWNPYSAMGEPHLGNIQTAALFPLYWPWYALGGEAAYGALLLARLWLAAMFWFVFARARLCSFAGAMVVGAAYAFGGYGLWFVQLVDLNSQMLLPLLLLALPKMALKPRITNFCASAALIALAIIGGHPEAAFVTLFVACLYTLTAIMVNQDSPHSLLCGRREAQDAGPSSPESRDRQSLPRSLLALSAAGAFGLLLSSATALPFLNYLSRCWTMHGPGFGFFHLDPRGLFNLIVPGIHVIFQDMPREIPVQYINYGALSMLKLPYSATGVPGNLPGAGLVVCALALYSIIRLRRLPWQALFFSGLLALTLGLTFGLPGFRLIALIPPFNMNANFKFFFSEIHVCLAVLAGVGLDAMWARAKDRGDKIRAIVYPVLMTLIILTALEFILDSSYADLIPGGFGARITYLYLLLQAPLLVFIVMFLQFKKAGARIIAHGLFMLAISSSLLIDTILVMPYIRLKMPGKEMLAALHSSADLRSGGEERIDGLEGFWPANRATLEGFKDVRSSDALFYKPYVDLINKINGLSAQESLGYFYPSYFTQPSPEKLLSEDARKLSLAFVVSDIKWVPSGVIDHIISRAKGIYGVWPPSRNMVHLEYLPEILGSDDISVRPFALPCLFLHAPAMVSFNPSSLSERPPLESRAPQDGTLSFIPHFQQISSSTDGAIFQVINNRDSGPSLLYSLYINPKRPHRNCCNANCGPSPKNTPILLTASGASHFQLSTHPGPRNNRDGDWSAFVALSWNDGPYVPPPEPLWSRLDRGGPLIYESPHLPWAHMEDEQELKVERSAGDEVAVDVSGAAGKELTVHEAWYPGWRVEIDGKDGVIRIPEDKVSWEVAVPKGAKKAVFRFEPYDFRIGLYGTLATALVLLMGLFFKPQMNTDERR